MTYINITCIKCGAADRNSFSEPYGSRMAERQMCFSCSHWTDFDIEMQTKHTHETIIGGNVYSPGNRTSGSFRGMAGRRFDIEYIEPSIHAGKRITTFDLWSGGMMPEWLKAKWPDTAKFLEGAERVNLDEGAKLEEPRSDALYTACWSPSQSRGEPYPLPSSLNDK